MHFFDISIIFFFIFLTFRAFRCEKEKRGRFPHKKAGEAHMGFPFLIVDL